MARGAMSRGRRAGVRTLRLVFGLAALAGTAVGQEQRPHEEPVPEAPLVEVVRPDQPVIRGFPIPNGEPDRTVHLIAEKDGKLHRFEVAEIQDFRVVAQRPVTDIPSRALVQAMALADRVARDRCYQWLSDQEYSCTEALLGGLDHESPEVRWRCLELLARMPTEKWVARIRRCLKDEDVTVRQKALSAYAKADPDDLVDVASRVLRKEEDPRMRHDAILILGYSGDAHGVDALLEHGEDTEDRALRLVTFASLRRLTDVNLGKDLDAWVVWWKNHRDEVLLEQERRRAEERR